MNTRTFALVYGIVFTLVGIAGFIPPLLWQPVLGGHDHLYPLKVQGFEGYLFGLFHVNWVHSLVHLLFGIGGLAASRMFTTAMWYARIVAGVYAVLAVSGAFGGFETMWGLMPIHGHDIWLHALLALPAFYYGFIADPRDPTTTQAPSTGVDSQSCNPPQRP